MTAFTLLDDLNSLGVNLEARGDRLHVDAPKGAITPDLLTHLKAYKADLLDAIRLDIPGGPGGYALAEIDRFFEIAEPHPSGNGFTDPSELDVVDVIRTMRPLTTEEITAARFVREWNEHRASIEQEKT